MVATFDLGSCRYVNPIINPNIWCGLLIYPRAKAVCSLLTSSSRGNNDATTNRDDLRVRPPVYTQSHTRSVKTIGLIVAICIFCLVLLCSICMAFVQAFSNQ